MSASQIHVVARVYARTGKEQELRAALEKLIDPTRAEEGCVSYQLLVEKGDPTSFTFVEEWASEDALSTHFASQHMADAVKAIEPLVTRPPEIVQYLRLR